MHPSISVFVVHTLLRPWVYCTDAKPIGVTVFAMLLLVILKAQVNAILIIIFVVVWMMWEITSCVEFNTPIIIHNRTKMTMYEH